MEATDAFLSTTQGSPQGSQPSRDTKRNAGSVGTVDTERRLKSTHVLYVLNRNALTPLFISLVFQAHMDLSLSSYHMYP